MTGIGVFALALFLSEKLGLQTLYWMLQQATILAPVVLVLLFLPELRQAIEGFAKVGEFSGRLIGQDAFLKRQVVSEVARAASEMAQVRTGALIILERSNRLDDIVRTGVPVRALVTSKLIEAIFYEGNPLHDGAIVIRDDTILAAACQLPLTESRFVSDKYHMRHRAGIGMSEQSDSVVLAVSEERGEISLMIEGRLEIMPDQNKLTDRLEGLMNVGDADHGKSAKILKRASKKEASS